MNRAHPASKYSLAAFDGFSLTHANLAMDSAFVRSAAGAFRPRHPAVTSLDGRAFRTVEYRITVTVDARDTWTYDEDTVLQVEGRRDPFHHAHRHTLTRIADPVPNPLAGPRIRP